MMKVALAFDYRRGALEMKGSSPRHRGNSIWMDAALFETAGTPTAVFGPTGAGLHAEKEWFDLDCLKILARILLATVEAFCE
jgi:acetylornithine deacetylase/succinyl-diaminopimelate desuccinylase-like protein